MMNKSASNLELSTKILHPLSTFVISSTDITTPPTEVLVANAETLSPGTAASTNNNGPGNPIVAHMKYTRVSPPGCLDQDVLSETTTATGNDFTKSDSLDSTEKDNENGSASATVVMEEEVTLASVSTTSEATGGRETAGGNSKLKKANRVGQATAVVAAKPDVLARTQSAHSQHSLTSSVGSPSSIAGDICRICHCEATSDTPLITPCYCAGSLKFVHQKCLQQWIKSSQTRSCEVCRYSFLMHTKLKPFRRWEKLDISSVERRKILCSVTFHVIAITCVVWSLYVLVERTADEIKSNTLEWPFWTKLVVVAIGFTGGLVFMYVQCKMYVQLFRRWRAYNKVIYVQDCPETASKRKGSPLHGSPHVIVEIKPRRTVTVTSAG